MLQQQWRNDVHLMCFFFILERNFSDLRKHVSVSWQQGKCQSWANCLIYWRTAANLGTLSWETRVRHTLLDKCSLLMHRIKIKSPLCFFMEWTKRFCGRIYHFSISLTLAVLQWQKRLPDIGGTTIQDVGPLLPWSLASTPWAMSLYLKFHAIYFWLLNE